MPQFLMPIIVAAVLAGAAGDAGVRRRRLVPASAPRARAAQPALDPPLMRFLYGALPVLIVCAVLRLLLAERLDFSAVLLGITVLTGVVWALDALWLAPRRAAAARARRQGPGELQRAGHGRLCAQLLPGGAGGAAAALLHLRAVPHPLRLDDADAARRRLHHRQQVRLRPAPAGAQPQDRRDRRAAARRRGGVPLPAGPLGQLHQAPGRAAGRSRAKCTTTSSSSTASRCRSTSARSATTTAAT